MNPLIKKEIRLLLPAWITALLLALVQTILPPRDFYVAFLPFLGMTVLALTSIGRETSLNTFSIQMAQPVERLHLWKIKLTVLATAFLTVFGAWFVAYGIAFWNSNGPAAEVENSYNLFITVCLLATATFTGGLWTTLLLRQAAAAFWLTLLLPVSLSGFGAAFFSQSQSNSGVIAILCVIFAVYSLGGFFFARRMFFRAQDTGWSGGTLVLPEWKWLAARLETTASIRIRKPVAALFKKELQLQQTALIGAVGLLVLHAGIIVLRANHKFAKDSAGEISTSIFWILWLVLPALIGSTAVAEERKLGVMEGQLCLPASRRRQFVIKTVATLLLGIFIGGVMPMLLEAIGAVLGSQNPVFMSDKQPIAYGLCVFLLFTLIFSTGLTLVSFFASSLARSFLQAVGFAVATLVGCVLIVPLFTNRHMPFYDSIAFHSILPLVIAVPTLIITLLGLAYRNFKSFREGWPLWWRNLAGLAGAAAFIVIGNSAIYHRVWEVFEPPEPAHGQAKFSLANPPVFGNERYNNLQARLPDGRIWLAGLDRSADGFDRRHWWRMWMVIIDPLPSLAGPQLFGTNWVSVHNSFGTVGIQADGTLWASQKSYQSALPTAALARFGTETNWQQVACGNEWFSVLLLKKDGTLWRWGTNYVEGSSQDWLRQWPGLRAFQPYQIGTNSDWREIFGGGGYHALKADGSVWNVTFNRKRDEVFDDHMFEQIPLPERFKRRPNEMGAYVKNDGTLWVYNNRSDRGQAGFHTQQNGHETNWVAVVNTWSYMVALKSDGTLWHWVPREGSWTVDFTVPPTRLGIHNDWVALTPAESGIVALAADGSLWFWPERNNWQYEWLFLQLPKQPKWLGNVFGQAN